MRHTNGDKRPIPISLRSAIRLRGASDSETMWEVWHDGKENQQHWHTEL